MPSPAVLMILAAAATGLNNSALSGYDKLQACKLTALSAKLFCSCTCTNGEKRKKTGTLVGALAFVPQEGIEPPT